LPERGQPDLIQVKLDADGQGYEKRVEADSHSPIKVSSARFSRLPLRCTVDTFPAFDLGKIQVVAVAEANLTSGALITADFATEYGRQMSVSHSSIAPG
jgi:hypothetical protein